MGYGEKAVGLSEWQEKKRKGKEVGTRVPTQKSEKLGKKTYCILSLQGRKRRGGYNRALRKKRPTICYE